MEPFDPLHRGFGSNFSVGNVTTGTSVALRAESRNLLIVL
jgi:hypothetical protein